MVINLLFYFDEKISDLFKIGHEITSETKGFWFWKGDFPGDEER
jgi:hypothetical protein